MEKETVRVKTLKDGSVYKIEYFQCMYDHGKESWFWEPISEEMWESDKSRLGFFETARVNLPDYTSIIYYETKGE